MSFADYGGFGEDYFEGERFSDGGHDAGYSRYGSEMLPYDGYAEFLDGRLSAQGWTKQRSVLVAGAGYGFTVDYLRGVGYVDTYGVDVSSWAAQRADALFGPDVVYRGDVLKSANLRNVRRKAGVGDGFDAALTESVLECLTDSEAVTACENLRSVADLVIHHVYTGVPENLQPQEGYLNETWYNAKTLSEWQSLCDPDGDDLWYAHREVVA